MSEPIPFEEALAAALSGVQTLGAERLPLGESLGRVLAHPLRARRALPPTDNSAMDGYALRRDEEDSPLPVTQVVPAGSWPDPLPPGEAARIFTGAPIPPGADTVVAQERCARDGDQVRVLRPEPLGANIRRAGEDIEEGALLAEPGTTLTPALLGLLAGQGLTWADVVRRPVVGVLATGDEIQEPGDPLPPGHIASSNSQVLAARIREAGAIPRNLGIVRDDRDSLQTALASLGGLDLLLTIGGVSVGEFDFVKEAIAALGGEQRFWTVRVRPGKPNAMGTLGTTRWFGLPGNPVSCDVSFLMYVRPVLRAMQGHAAIYLPTQDATLAHDLRKRPGFLLLFRGIHSQEQGRTSVRTTGPQGSGIQSSMARATCLIVAPEDSALLPAGSTVRIVLLPGEAASSTPNLR